MSKNYVKIEIGYANGEVGLNLEGVDGTIVWTPGDAMEVAKLLMTAALKAVTNNKENN